MTAVLAVSIKYSTNTGWRTEYSSKHWMVFYLLMGYKGCLHLKVLLLRQPKRTSSWHVDTIYLQMLLQTPTVFTVENSSHWSAKSHTVDVDRINSSSCKQGFDSIVAPALCPIIGISTQNHTKIIKRSTNKSSKCCCDPGHMSTDLAGPFRSKQPSVNLADFIVGAHIWANIVPQLNDSVTLECAN